MLEVDGAFHMEVEHWAADVKRQRKITTPRRTVIRATALELRLEPEGVVEDLRALGVPERSGRAGKSARGRTLGRTTREARATGSPTE